MALVARDVIKAAEQEAFRYLGPQKIGRGFLLSVLSDIDEEVVYMCNTTAPHLITEREVTMSVDTSLNLYGYALREASAYLRFTYIDADSGEPTNIEIVPEAKLETTTRPVAGTIKQCKFFPADPNGKAWSDITESRPYFFDGNDSIRYSYLPEAAILTSLNDELASPRLARSYIIKALVLEVLMTQELVSETAVQRAILAAGTARDQLEMQMYKHVKTQHSAGRA